MADEAPLHLAVVVVNWNRAKDTARCLRSLGASRFSGWRALVVDNGSSDGSAGFLRSAFPEVEILETGRNLGFAGGTNVGIERALALGVPYILLLNNDAEVAPDALPVLLEAAAVRPRAGIFSPLILYGDGRRVWFAGAYRRRVLPGFAWPAYGSTRLPRPVPRRIDYATGCAMLLRREVLQTVGLLDPAYFMYWEDMDLCERARRAGWEVWLIPSAVVRHHVSSSLGEWSAEKWYHLARHIPTFYLRYYRRPRAAMLAYVGWVTVRELLRGNAPCVAPLWRGFWDGWRAEVRGRSEDAGSGQASA
ncbi:MAG: glycosyltransferase family 2 protein [Chloroflexia bacterium]